MRTNRLPRMIYLCGPRTGQPDTNIPLFASITESLRTLGHGVINPVDVNLAFLGRTYSPPVPESFLGEPFINRLPGLRADIIAMVTACDSIALIPGWDDAIGCRLEVGIAITFGYLFIDYQTGEVIERPKSVKIAFGYLDRPPAAVPPGVTHFRPSVVAP